VGGLEIAFANQFHHAAYVYMVRGRPAVQAGEDSSMQRDSHSLTAARP